MNKTLRQTDNVLSLLSLNLPTCTILKLEMTSLQRSSRGSKQSLQTFVCEQLKESPKQQKI